MALTPYINIFPSVEDLFFGSVQPIDRFTYARVRTKNLLLSRKTKKGLGQRTLLPEIGVAWAGLSDAVKLDWSNAGAECNLNGWRLFVQDYCARRVNDIAGLATPSLLHQCWVGQIHIEAPASEALLIQTHPRNYYVSQKVYGKKREYNPVLITEPVSWPFTLSLNYSSNLVAEGPDPYAKIYAEFWYSYQGANLYYNLEIPLDLITGWKTANATLSDLTSYCVRYDLHIHLHDLRGDLYFDNVSAYHSAQNWTRDAFCKDIDQSFTRNYYQIPKHWAAQILTEGADFESIYKDF